MHTSQNSFCWWSQKIWTIHHWRIMLCVLLEDHCLKHTLTKYIVLQFILYYSTHAGCIHKSTFFQYYKRVHVQRKFSTWQFTIFGAINNGWIWQNLLVVIYIKLFKFISKCFLTTILLSLSIFKALNYFPSCKMASDIDSHLFAARPKSKRKVRISK